MSDLIKVTTNEKGDQLVNARELYTGLEIKWRFSEWWNSNTKGFLEGVDYTPYVDLHPQNKQEIQNYAMNLDMAKHLAMQTQSKKGFEVRQYFIKVEKEHKQSQLDTSTITPELEIKRQNAEARLKNANSRQAALLNKIAESAPSDVNKAILQSKATEVLTGEKLLEMPVVGNKYFDSNEIAKKVGVFSKSGKPHQTAISQFIKNEIDVLDNEKEEFAGEKNGWSGSVTKYTQSVIDKVELALEDTGYPNVIQSGGKRYSVIYQ